MGLTVLGADGKPAGSVEQFVMRRAMTARGDGSVVPEWRGTVRIPGLVHMRLAFLGDFLKLSRAALIAQLVEAAVDQSLGVLRAMEGGEELFSGSAISQWCYDNGLFVDKEQLVEDDL